MSLILYPGMFLHELDLPSEFHSLVIRLNSIYGPGLSIESLFRISASDFSNCKGVGETYLIRFKALKDLLYKRYCDDNPQIFSEYPTEKITYDSKSSNTTLLKIIKKCFPKIKSYKDISTISPDEFTSYPGVGKKKVLELLQWQTQLKSNEKVYQEKASIIQQLENYRFSAFFLLPQEEKLLRKLHNLGIPHNEIIPSYIMKIEQSEMEKWDGFGVVFYKVLHSLQYRILESLTNKSSIGILIPNRFGHSLSLRELSPLIAEDLSNFYSILSGKNAIIWSARLGYQAKQMTLQELGLKLDLTRERIRQVSKRLNGLFLRGVRVHPDILQQKIKKGSSGNLVEIPGNLIL